MSHRGTQATVGAAAVVTTALLVAALSRPVQVLSRPGSSGSYTYLPAMPTTTSPSPPTETTRTLEPGTTPIDMGLLVGIFVQIALALVALALIFAVALLVQAAIRRRPRLVAPDGSAFRVPPVPEDLLESAPARMSLLESGEPRNAIVAAWLDLERHAAASGLPRHPSETSTEYATRVIGTWRVDQGRLADLAQLYREARFSLHALGESARQRAIDDLLRLHDDLERAASEDRARDGGPT